MSEGRPVDVKPRRVQARLLRVFVLQLALISSAAAVGVLAAGYVAEQVLVKRALFGEATYFWKRRAADPGFALPDTLNLNSFLVSGERDTASSVFPPGLPQRLRALPLGIHRLVVDGLERTVHVSERNGERLYLLFQQKAVSQLAFWFGLVPLTLVLLVMYGFAWLAYALSKRAVSPITELAGAIERFDFNARDASELDLEGLRDAPDSETRVLVDAIGQFIARGQASIERERNFTRYSSHELRTPLSVIAGSVSTLDLLGLEGGAGRAVERIGRTSRQMSELIDTLLLLARESASVTDGQVTDVVRLLEELVGQSAAADRDNGLIVTLHAGSALRVRAGEAVLSIVLGNLVRNARTYTGAGRVDIVVGPRSVGVRDTGPGLDEQERLRVFEPFYRADNGRQDPALAHGTGLGLAIVRQTCDDHGWRITLSSTPGKGSRFSVDFGDTVVPDESSPRGNAQLEPSSSR